MGVTASCLALVWVSAAGVASAAQTKPPAVSVWVERAPPALIIHIRARARARCTLRVVAKTTSWSFPPVGTSSQGKASIAWAVPTNAPRGKWVFSVSCRIGHGTYRASRTFIH